MSRRAQVLVASALVSVLAATFVVPAFGGPSAFSLAKKALRSAKSAKSSASRASAAARRASSAASTAQTTATSALNNAAAADLGPRLVYLTRQVFVSNVPGSDFGSVTIVCPAGYRVAGSAMSPGAITPVAEAVGSAAVVFTGYNSSTTSTYSYYAHVNCVESSGYSVARASSRQQVERLAREATVAFARTHSK